MSNLKTLKQEAREELKERFKDNRHVELSLSGEMQVGEFLEETLDRLTDEIEKAVVPNVCITDGDPRDVIGRAQADAHNLCRKDVQLAFTRFKGESVAEGECSCEEPHVSKRVVHVRKGEGSCHIV